MKRRCQGAQTVVAVPAACLADRASCVSTLLGRVLMTTLCKWLALGQGECQKFVPGEHFPLGDMPIFAAARGYLGVMLRAPAERSTCPTTAAGPEGHAHSSLRPEDTWASCSVPVLSDEHAQVSSLSLIHI